MATKFSTLLNGDSTNTANLSAWAQFIEDTLVTVGGWTVANDTGQTLPSALPAPTTNSQKCGFRIYNMSDALQGTYPVAMRIDYGSGTILGSGISSPPYSPGLFLTIGTGSNGSGTITGPMLTNAQVSGNAGGGSSSALTCYASANRGRCTFGMFCVTGTGIQNYFALIFGVERWKDTSGADIGGGLMVVYSSPFNVGGNLTVLLAYSPCLAFGTVSQQTIDQGLNYVHTTTDPSPTHFGDKGVGVLFHFRGTVIQPGTNFLVSNLTDMASGSYVFVNIYGRQHTYQNLPGISPWVGAIAAVGFGPTGQGDTSRRILMRYD